MSARRQRLGWLDRLWEPDDTVQDPVERRRARFLAVIVVLLPLISTVALALQVYFDPRIAWTATYQIPLFLASLGLFAIARTRHWRVALGIVVAMAVLATAIALSSRPGNTVVYAYLLVPALLATALLSIRQSVVVALLMIVATVCLGSWFLPEPVSAWLGSVAATVGLLLTLAVVATRHRVGIERDRQREIEARDEVSRRLLEASFGGLVLVRDGQIAEANPGFARLFGVEPEDLLGQPIDDFLPSDTPLGSLADRGRNEIAARRADGSYVPVAVVTRIGSDPDASTHVVAVQDLTEREAVRARMHQVDRMAAMGQLAAGVAHEINNPLTWIIGNLEEVVDRVAAEDRGHIQQAIEGARRVRRIARDLNTFSRDGSGPLVGIDVVDVARSSVNMVRHDLNHHGTLHEVYDTAPTVDGDPTRLGQVFMNLLANAAHAIAGGAGTSVWVRVGRDEQGWASFEVEDDGLGIPADLHARVFEPFFSTKSEGTGLGLAISRTLVDELGGELWLDPDRDRGTRMVVRLPPGNLAVMQREDTGEEARPASRAARILVVDDEPAICKLLEVALGEHHVQTASSGEEGLQRALSEEWDVILCDLMMPVVSGIDLFDAVREQRPGLQARIVFLTGGAFTPRARTFLDEVENEVLNKPFRLSKVRDIVAAVLER